MKTYIFKLPESKKLSVSDTAKPNNWLDSQNLPVYAYIMPKDCDMESISTGGDAYTEMECAFEDPGGVW